VLPSYQIFIQEINILLNKCFEGIYIVRASRLHILILYFPLITPYDTVPARNPHNPELVLCQEKVQVKHGFFVKSMEAYSSVFCDHVFQIIQFDY